MNESGSLLVMQTHLQSALNIFNRFKSDFLKPLSRSAIIESPK
jgi:hypothetical protein